MILSISHLNKSIGLKELYKDLSFSINEGQKVALIGRNGLGKTSLFKMIIGDDSDYQGIIEKRKNTKIILTKQEHSLLDDISAFDYILNDVPNFRELQAIIGNFEQNPSSDIEQLQIYTDAINHFAQNGYYEIEDKIILSLEAFQIDTNNILNPLSTFSGGEKRFVELVRVMYSGSDLALIDEPTNHMDYIGKELFIDWFKNTKQAVLVVTHDRDVLNYVDAIYELKDKQIVTSNGNYSSYLQQNNSKTISSISKYETDLKKMSDLKRKITEAAKNKAYKSGKIVYDRFVADYNELKNNLVKPSFWIDQESLEEVSKQTLNSYHKYKEKNITIRHNANDEHKKELIKIKNLSVGYHSPLFSNIDIHLYNYDRIFVKGRNGAGKSTLIKTIVSQILESTSPAKIYSGEFKFSSTMRLGIYEQEINPIYLTKTLADAVYEVYDSQRIDIDQQKVAQLLSSYLFNPLVDSKLTLETLSGGQKARFQLIKMLSNNPNVLILDEPTNHLDLPSIEQLENVLANFTGAILYVTHDNYLIEKLRGKIIDL